MLQTVLVYSYFKDILTYILVCGYNFLNDGQKLLTGHHGDVCGGDTVTFHFVSSSCCHVY